MNPTTEQIQRLMEVAMVAAGNGLATDAETIFQGIAAVRRDSELPLVGRAFLSMNRGRFPEAIDLLQQALEKQPDSELALGFLGAALKFSGMNQAAEQVLEQVSGHGNNKAAVALADSLLHPA